MVRVYFVRLNIHEFENLIKMDFKKHTSGPNGFTGNFQEIFKEGECHLKHSLPEKKKEKVIPTSYKKLVLPGSRNPNKGLPLPERWGRGTFSIPLSMYGEEGRTL